MYFDLKCCGLIPLKRTNVFTTTIMFHYDFMFVNYAVIPQQCCIKEKVPFETFRKYNSTSDEIISGEDLYHH